MEFFNSLLEAFKSRLKNPILGTFTISWLLINWKIVTIYFSSDLSNSQIIQHIQNQYMHDYWSLIGLPVISTIVLALGLPKVFEKREEHWLVDIAVNRHTSNARLNRAKIEEVMSDKDLKNINTLVSDINEQQELFEKNKTEWEQTQKDLKDENAHLSDEIEAYKETVRDIENTIKIHKRADTKNRTTIESLIETDAKNKKVIQTQDKNNDAHMLKIKKLETELKKSHPMDMTKLNVTFNDIKNSISIDILDGTSTSKKDFSVIKNILDKRFSEGYLKF